MSSCCGAPVGSAQYHRGGTAGLPHDGGGDVYCEMDVLSIRSGRQRLNGTAIVQHYYLLAEYGMLLRRRAVSSILMDAGCTGSLSRRLHLRHHCSWS